jgi:hypothetical protein
MSLLIPACGGPTGAILRATSIACLTFLVTAATLPNGPQFTDVTARAGIKFTHNAGKAGKKYLPETMGSGVAFFDADGDGWEDLLFVNSRSWVPRAGRRSTAALYRNNGKGAFTDITRGSGLDVEIYGMGVAAGDYDNDGRDDLYITALEGDRLFHNEGGGKFRDVTAESGIGNSDFGTSAAWVDYDRDGRLDLFIANYVAWSQKGDLWCSLDGATKSYCTPESYKGLASKLYRNAGGKFEDVSKSAGVGDPTSKSLGVAVLDYNNDGWPDLFIANDTQPNKLYKNNRNGTFTEEGVSAGVAFGEDGAARGAMGVSVADYDRTGRPHLLVGNFSNQMLGLYHNEGNALFVDEAPRSTVGRASLLNLTFGLFFFDYDLDGWQDIFTANGHIDEEIGRVQPRIQFEQPPLLLRNQGKGRFEDISKRQTAAFQRAIVARGAAYADFDRDGDLDIAISTNHGPAYLFRNDGGNANQWLRLKLVGTKSNRSAIGAKVTLESAGGRQTQTVHSGSSYCSQSELTLTFGLGGDTKVNTIDVEWPSGAKQRLTNVDARQHLTIKEQ